MTDIKKFIGEIYENCSGSGNSDGSGDGYNRCGNGYGDKHGFGCGCGSEDNNGFGYGYGCDCGCGDKYGYGHGYGDGIKSINGFPVYPIDGIPTGIISAKGNVAKGFILRKDLMIKFCYIVKNYDGIYAHGKTLKEAQEALRDKQLKKMPIEERLQLFKRLFDKDELYEGQEFYDWHHILTGSCKMGRDSFCEEHGIDLKAKYTVKDFIELTENSYGGDIIKKLKDMYKI